MAEDDIPDGYIVTEEKCTQCHKPLEQMIEDGFDIYSNGRTTISVDGYELYCPRCDIYFMTCDSCTREYGHRVFCKFLGTDGVFVPPTAELEYDENGYCSSEYYLYAPNCPPDDPKFEQYHPRHQGYTHYPRGWSWTPEQLSKFPDEMVDVDPGNGEDPMRLVKYYVGFMDVYYLPRYLQGHRVWPTGPDGNYYNFWKCMECGDVAFYQNH